MATRELTDGDLTRSSKNGEGADPKVPNKPLPAIGKTTGRKGRRREQDERALPGGFQFATGKPVVLPGKQVKPDQGIGYLSPLDTRRRSLAQDEDTIDAIKTVRDIDPAFSNAIWNYLRLINPGCDLKAYAYKIDGSEEEEGGEGQLFLDQIAAKVAAEYGGGLDQLIPVLALVLLTNGAAALEVEVNATLSGVVDWHPVDPMLLSFRREEEPDGVERLHLGQDIGSTWERLNETQVFYFPLDPDIGDPYGRPPMVAAVQQVLYLAQLIADLRAVAHQQGYPRLDISVLWEQIQQAAPPTIRDDPTLFQEWATQQLGAIVSEYEDLNTDDVFIHYDFVKVGTSGGAAGSMDFVGLEAILTRRLTMSLKALPITLGINESTSETHGSIQWQIQVAGIENFQRGVKRLIEKAANLSLKVRGIQCHAKVEFGEIRTVDRLYEAQSDYYDRQNAKMDVDEGWIDADEAAERIVGHAATGEKKAAPGTGAMPEGFAQGGEPGGGNWWDALFSPGAESQGGANASNPDPNMQDLQQAPERGNQTLAWVHMLLDQQKERGLGRGEFRDTAGDTTAGEAALATADPDDPLNDVARYAEAGKVAFLELRRELIEVLVLEGFLPEGSRDLASDISETFRRSFARQMKGLLRQAVRDGLTLANPDEIPVPESLVDRIWRRNLPYVERIEGDLAAAIRAGEMTSLEALEGWFDGNAWREKLMGRHLGKQGLAAGWSYALEGEGYAFRWTRTILESCVSCVERGGMIFNHSTLVAIGFPGSDALACGANCLCILDPVGVDTMAIRAAGWEETDHPRGDDGKFAKKPGSGLPPPLPADWTYTAPKNLLTLGGEPIEEPKPQPVEAEEDELTEADKARLDAAAAVILRGEADFAAAGGKLVGPGEHTSEQRDKWMGDASSVFAGINKQALSPLQQEHLLLSETMIHNAFWDRRSHIVALTPEGHVAGAYGYIVTPARYDLLNKGWIGGGYMGSFSTVKGTGSALFGSLVREAARQDLRFREDVLFEARPFWAKMGVNWPSDIAEAAKPPAGGTFADIPNKPTLPADMSVAEIQYLAGKLK